MENTLVVVIFVISFIIMFIIVNYYSKKEEVKSETKKECDEIHSLKNRIDCYKNSLYSSYRINEYKIGDWEKIVRNDMKPIIKITDKYKTNKNVNILIGDYDRASVSNSVCVLESMGLNVNIAKSGIEIMERLDNGEIYDLIITNNIYDRGSCDGPQMLSELRTYDYNIPIVVLTVSHNKRGEFLAMGFDEYMTKLLDQTKVLDMMSKVLPDIIFEKIN